MKYIFENTKYPDSAKVKNISGRVVARFCITETGSIEKISIIKGVHPSLDAETIRVISTLPAFIPGRSGGVPVPVWYMLPITFSLQ